MAVKDPRIDAYIANAAPFAQPILRKLRELFHRASPKIEETIKWGCPSFGYKGIIGGMAAFKNHVGWGLWKSKLLTGVKVKLKSEASSHMSGGDIKHVSELSPDAGIIAVIREAGALNEKGVKLPQRSGAKKPPPKTPADLAAALKKNAKSAASFAGFSPSHRREYIEWITEAKAPETRARRIAQAIEWLTEGKPRNWKYMKKP